MRKIRQFWISREELEDILGVNYQPSNTIDAGNVGGLIQGSIPFANATGFLIEDNANLFWDAAEANLGIGTNVFGATMTQGIQIATGLAPTANVPDTFAFYSADFVAGNACPHFRTENGTVIGLNQGLLTTDNVVFGTIGCGTITVANGASINLQEDITFTGATGVNLIKFPDNLPDALSFMEGANPYQTFITTNGSEAVQFHEDVLLKASTEYGAANKTTAAWSKTIGSGGDYADWATMIADMPDLIAHAVTVTIETGTTLTEICDIKNKHGITSAGTMIIQAEDYFPTSGVIPTASGGSANTLVDAAIGWDVNKYADCWVFIIDAGTDNITGVTVGGAGAGEFKVAGDLTARYLAADKLIVTGSTNNDGVYTISVGGSTHAGGITTIPVNEAVAAVADGTVATYGVLENGYCQIDSNTADTLTLKANWPECPVQTGDRYIIVGALIDGGGVRNYGMDIRNNSASLTLRGIGVLDSDFFGYFFSSTFKIDMKYCGVFDSDNSGIWAEYLFLGDFRYNGIVDNNTVVSLLYAGVSVFCCNRIYLVGNGITNNKKRGILVEQDGYALVNDNFGGRNGDWGTYCKWSGQAFILGIECYGSSGNHSDEGTAGDNNADQAAAYT